MNLTFRNNRIYNLVIEDHPDPLYQDLPAVDPRGILSSSMLEQLGQSLYGCGVKCGYWSNKANLYIANVCIGVGEMSDTSLPLISYVSGLAEYYHKEINNNQVNVMDVINPPVMNMDEISNAIASNFPNCEQPYTVPFVIYDEVVPDFKGSIPAHNLEALHQLGDEYFGVGATTLILPILTSKVSSNDTQH
jgi:hypothetical protein